MATQTEVQRIYDKIDALSAMVAEGFSRCLLCQGEIKDIQSDLKNVMMDINGAPGNGDAPGLKMRVDRVEESRRRLYIAVGLAATIASAVAAVLGFIIPWIKTAM